MNPSLAARVMPRHVLAEAVGTAFLVAAVVGPGIAAQRLSPHDVGLQLLENSLITDAALIALILALQPISAAFNPIVTLLERALGADDTRTTTALIAAQIAGGIAGCVVAKLMFSLHAVTLSTRHRTGSGIWLGEVVATLGLLLVIFGTVGAGRSERVAFRGRRLHHRRLLVHLVHVVRNPAGTIARMVSDSFAGIAELGRHVRAHAVCRWPARLRTDPRPLSEHRIDRGADGQP